MALLLFLGTTFQSPPKANGSVNSGGKIYFYEPGTSTLKDTYTTSALTVANANPLILDANGRGTAWLNGTYKIRLFDSTDVLIDEEDNYNKGSTFDITAVTAARTVVGLDDTNSFTHSGTYSVSLTQASTLGAGWFTRHFNIGTGVVTFARLAVGDTINGSTANFTLQPGEEVLVVVNGATTGFVVSITKPDIHAVASGTDTYTCTFAPAISALYSGQKLRVRFTNTNATTTPSLNANGIGAKTIVKDGSAALVAGDIPAGHEAALTYNGTNLVLENPMGLGQAKFNAAGTMTAGSVPAPRISAGAIPSGVTIATARIDQDAGIKRGHLATVVADGAAVIGSGLSTTLALAGVDWSWWTGSSSTSTFSFGAENPADGIIGVHNIGAVTGTFHVDERYISASPPYDIGDGEVPLFAFVLIDSTGKVYGTQFAFDPPWAYRGPTKIYPGKHRKQMPCSYKEACTNPVKMALYEAALADPYEIVTPEMITMDRKNRDMPLFPHPFFMNDLTRKTVVMACLKTSEKLRNMLESGEPLSKLAIDGYLKFDNTAVKQRTPPGVIAVRCNLK